MITKTGERVVPENFISKEEYFIYLRHIFAYEFAEKQLPQNCLVLEAGSGEGYGTYQLSQSAKIKNIIGIDVDAETIAHASKKYISTNCSFKHYNGNKIPFADESFDAVISFQVIEHIENDKNYVAEIFRILKNNGILILSTPNRVSRLKPGQKPWNRFHVREYDNNTLKEILRTKFQNIQILGVKGNVEIQQNEMNRTKKIMKIISFDPLNLRNVIPEKIKNIIIKALKKIIFKKPEIIKEDFISKYSTKDFYTIQNNFDDSLDLLAICKKIKS